MEYFLFYGFIPNKYISITVAYILQNPIGD